MQLPTCAVQVTFEQDVVLSQANEYEVLQLLLADMRDRLTSFEGTHCLAMAPEACLLGSSLQKSLADVCSLTQTSRGSHVQPPGMPSPWCDTPWLLRCAGPANGQSTRPHHWA